MNTLLFNCNLPNSQLHFILKILQVSIPKSSFRIWTSKGLVTGTQLGRLVLTSCWSQGGFLLAILDVCPGFEAGPFGDVC